MKYKTLLFILLFFVFIVPISLAAPLSETENMTLGTENSTVGPSSTGPGSVGSGVGLGASATTTTAAAAAAPSAGGGGGGGPIATTTTTAAPTAVTETKSIPSIQAGSSATVSVNKSDDLKIQEIKIDVKNSVSNVQITVKESSLPAGTNVAIASDIGAVFKYLEISKTNITDNDISKVKIKFKVDKAWLDANGIDLNTVSLQKLVGSAWQKQTTTKVSEDSKYVYYEAESSTLSLFAITGIKKAVTTTTTPPTTTTTSPAIPPLVKPTENIVYVVIGLVIIIALVYLILRRKKLIKPKLPPLP